MALSLQVSLVISNKADVKGLELAESMGIRTLVVPHTQIREHGDRKMTEVGCF